MPIPSKTRPGKRASSSAKSLATRSGSLAHTFKIPVATTIRSVASNSGASAGS